MGYEWVKKGHEWGINGKFEKVLYGYPRSISAILYNTPLIVTKHSPRDRGRGCVHFLLIFKNNKLFKQSTIIFTF